MPTPSSHRLLALVPVLTAAFVLQPGAAAQVEAPAADVPPQRSADGYTRYELHAPGTGGFRILYEVTAVTPGATRYYNTLRAGARVLVHQVVDRASGEPLPWRILEGRDARMREHPTANPEGRFIEVDLPRPVPVQGGVRLLIDKTYVDGESYFMEGNEVVFSRSLSVPRNSIVLPAGYEVIEVNVPSQVALEEDGRIRVSFMNPNAQALEVRVRARPLPELGARLMADTEALRAGRPGTSVPEGMATAGYDGSFARTDRSFAERAREGRDIVYHLQQPESSAFRLFHDYTEDRPGQSRYLNVVRAGSRVEDPWAFLLDTGEELPLRTLRGRRVADEGILSADRVDESTEVVVVDFPEVREGTTVRIRIHETYIDEDRYTLAGEELVWDRRFGRSMNQVVLPAGWFLTASDIPASVRSLDDGRIHLTFWNPRPDGIQVFLRALPRREAVTRSLAGERLFARPHPAPERLAEVDAALAASPDDIELLIEAGRERRHAFLYDEEVAHYTRALALAPDDWRLHRFRGHRQLSLRDFEAGVRDLERARELAPGDFDVAYHLGLAYYLSGDFARAADEYLRCLALADDPASAPEAVSGGRPCTTIATSDDTRVAITEWAWRALMRAGREGEAERLLEGIHAEMEVTANTAYLRALLAHRGELPYAELVEPFPLSGRFETHAYAAAVAELVRGDEERAHFFLRRVAEDPHWPGFGRIEAEADLARLAR